MALKGNLRDFSITQLLYLINIAQKTGTLLVKRSTQIIAISFREGKLTFAQDRNEDNSLAAVLYRASKISDTQWKTIRDRSGGMSDKELGLLLINANYITQKEILTSLQKYYTQVLEQLFDWEEGSFHFEMGFLPPDDRITIKVNLENIILEGTRRIREFEHLQDEIPSLEMALKFTERPGMNIQKINLSAEEWQVVSYVNPQNTMQQIAKATKKSDLEIRKIVFSLLQTGLVEIIRPQSASAAVAPVSLNVPKTTVEEKKSLINRIIDRIRAI